MNGIRAVIAILMTVAASTLASAACAGAFGPPEELVGVWEAASTFEYTLTLNEDCTFEIDKGYSDPYKGEWTYALYGNRPYVTLTLAGLADHDVVPVERAVTSDGPTRALCVLLAYEPNWEGGFAWSHCGLILLERIE